MRKVWRVSGGVPCTLKRSAAQRRRSTGDLAMLKPANTQHNTALKQCENLRTFFFTLEGRVAQRRINKADLALALLRPD